MALFGLGKKKEEKNAPVCCCAAVPREGGCCCGGPVEGNISIKVLGAGCKTCHQQFENVKEAVHRLGLAASVEYITDMEKIMAFGVMVMPAIVIDEKVAVSGRLLSTRDVEKLLGGR